MALADASDSSHQAARSFRDQFLRTGGSFLSTDFVMDETLTLIRMRMGVEASEGWWNQGEASRRLSREKSMKLAPKRHVIGSCDCATGTSRLPTAQAAS